MPPGNASSWRRPRPLSGVSVASAAATLCEVGADQLGGAEHGQRILDDVPAGRADPRRDLAAADLGDDRRAVRLELAFDQLDVGARMLAEAR